MEDQKSSDQDSKVEKKPKPQNFKKPKKVENRNFFLEHYDKNYKKILIIPLIIFATSVLILFYSYSQTGEFFQKDVSIKGGVTVTVLNDYQDIGSLEDFLSKEIGTSVSVRKLAELGSSRGIILEAGIESDEDVEKLMEALQTKTGRLSEDQYSVQVIGSALGSSFFEQMIKGIVFAFILMGLVVFFYFRFAAGQWAWIPGLFVIWTVFVDIISTLAVVSLLQIKVSTAGLAAFLLLIGYSVDTDILLTMRMLRSRQEKIFDRVLSAARTGILMTVAGLVAVTTGLLVTQSDTIRQIMLILVIGLVFDLLNTWLTNTGILRWYLERKRYGSSK